MLIKDDFQLYEKRSHIYRDNQLLRKRKHFRKSLEKLYGLYMNIIVF